MTKELNTSLNNLPSLPDLEKHVHKALHLWSKADPDDSPLHYLYLVKQNQRQQAGMPWNATNRVLLDALKALKIDDGEGEKLLRRRFLDGLKMQAIANEFNVSEGTAYKRQQEAIKRLSKHLHYMEKQARAESQMRLESRAEFLPKAHLIGLKAQTAHLLKLLITPQDTRIISIEGLGGIGKTALANALVYEAVLTGYFKDIAWISAKQQEFLPIDGIQPVNEQAALDVDTLLNSLLNQLNEGQGVSEPPQAKLAILTTLLKETPYFVVVDNLETVTDYKTLLPTLFKLVNPSKVLLTSRHSLQGYSQVFCQSQSELKRDDALALLQYEAQTRGIKPLIEAPIEQLERIYQVVGGNPLALKLVAGQVNTLPLSQILENLKDAQNKTVADLYTYIYWQAWRNLDAKSQEVLLTMPLVAAQGGTLTHLTAVSGFSPSELSHILELLVRLSLVEVRSGDVEDRRYGIHRLTETFLLTEASSWF